MLFAARKENTSHALTDCRNMQEAEKSQSYHECPGRKANRPYRHDPVCKRLGRSTTRFGAILNERDFHLPRGLKPLAWRFSQATKDSVVPVRLQVGRQVSWRLWLVIQVLQGDG